MLNGMFFKVSLLITTIICFYMFLSSPVLGGDCVDCQDCEEEDAGSNIPSSPGNIEYTENWREQYRVKIYASSGTIKPKETITLHVESESLAIPPYTWSTSSIGYSLDKSITQDNLETVTLTAPDSSGTCGTDYDIVATVKVIDARGETDAVEIRNTNGAWVYNGCVFGDCGTGMYRGSSGDVMGHAYYKIQTKGSMWTHLYCNQQKAINLLNVRSSYGFTSDDIYCHPTSNKLVIFGGTCYCYRILEYIWSCS